MLDSMSGNIGTISENNFAIKLRNIKSKREQMA